MAQETALRFLRILRGLLFPHIVPRFPTTPDYSVACSTTLLLCKLLCGAGRKQSCARHGLGNKLMKTKGLLLMLFTAAVLLTGCKKDESLSGGGSQAQETTYDVYIHDLSVPSGMRLECLVIEYSNQNEPLKTNRFNVASQQVINRSYMATDNSVKVKVGFNIYSTTSSQSTHLWVQQVFYLNKGGNTQVEITSSSPSGPHEP